MIKINNIKFTRRNSYIFIQTDLPLRKGNILTMIYNPENEKNPGNYYLEVVGMFTENNNLQIVLDDIGYYKKVERIKSTQIFDLIENGKIKLATKEEIEKAEEQRRYC
jgi:hypothetical protein